MARGGLVRTLATEHAADLLDHALAVEPAHAGAGPLAGDVLLEREVGPGQRGDLWQVGDAEHLAALAEGTQPLADGTCGLAADPGVDLVEDQRAGPRPTAEAAQRQHHAGELAS